MSTSSGQFAIRGSILDISNACGDIFTTLADEGKAGRIEFLPVDKTLHEGFADNA